MSDSFVYKILTPQEYEMLDANGSVGVSDLDRRDGFVHLSTAMQIEATWKRFFAAHPVIHLLRFRQADLDDHLVWEMSEKDELFPHFYGQLLVTARDREYRIDRSDPDHLSTIGSLP